MVGEEELVEAKVAVSDKSVHFPLSARLGLCRLKKQQFKAYMSHQFEGMLADIDRYGDQLQFQRRLNAKEKLLEKLEADICKLYGVREALMAQLQLHDPKNPLLVDIELRRRIGEAAVQAFYSTPDPDGIRNYDRARDVGRTFKIPGR